LYFGFTHCCQNITFSALLLFTFHIHLWEETSLPQYYAYGFNCFPMWNCVNVGNTASILQRQPHHLHCRNSACQHTYA
jgi:hypothetical protein